MVRVNPGHLANVRRILEARGFRHTVWQYAKHGQVFGLVWDFDPRAQMHVRGYSDGRLEAEVEVSRYYLEHHSWPATNADYQLAHILSESRIPYRSDFPIRPGPSYDLPDRLTDWRPLAGLAVLAIGASLLFGRR